MGVVFQHADGRIMVDEGNTGGIGGGITSRFHRLADEVEAAAYRLLHGLDAPEVPVIAEVPQEDAAPAEVVEPEVPEVPAAE